jgi:hypothetical protein
VIDDCAQVACRYGSPPDLIRMFQLAWKTTAIRVRPIARRNSGA